MIKFSKRKTTSQFIYPVHGVHFASGIITSSFLPRIRSCHSYRWRRLRDAWGYITCSQRVGNHRILIRRVRCLPNHSSKCSTSFFLLRSSPGTNNRGRCVIRHPCLSHVRRRAPSQSSTRADSPRHECFHHFAQGDFPSKLQAQIITGRWHCRTYISFTLWEPITCFTFHSSGMSFELLPWILELTIKWPYMDSNDPAWRRHSDISKEIHACFYTLTDYLWTVNCIVKCIKIFYKHKCRLCKYGKLHSNPKCTLWDVTIIEGHCIIAFCSLGRYDHYMY